MAVLGRALAQFRLEDKAAGGRNLSTGGQAAGDFHLASIATASLHRARLEAFLRAGEHHGLRLPGLQGAFRHRHGGIEAVDADSHIDEQPGAPGAIGVGQCGTHSGGTVLLAEQAADVVDLAQNLGAQVLGKVNYVGSLLGEQNRAATVRATLANPNGAWRPGLFVNVAVSVDRFDAAVAVPESALQTWEAQTVVFARTEEGFEARPVKTGRRDAGQVEITSGLAAGTQVAAAGSFVLKSELGKGSAEHSH